MLSVDKYTNVLGDKKETVVTTLLSENKLLKTEKVRTIDELYKRTENITTGGGVVKGNDEVHKRTQSNTKNEEVEKGYEKLEDMKEVVVTIRRKCSYKFECQSKGSIGQFNPDDEFLKESFILLNQTSIKNFMKIILKVYTWNRINLFFNRFILLS